VIPSILKHGGVTLEPVESEPELLLHLLATPRSYEMLGAVLTSTAMARSFFDRMASELWCSPMRIDGGGASGLLLNAETDPGSLNTRVVCLVEDGAEPPPTAIALFARHLFWSFPLHRLYVEVPVSATEVEVAFSNAGFLAEGTLVEHAVVSGRPEDVRVMGMLRRDFHTWAATTQPELSLQDGR
jgi:hypothetical protein